VVNQSKSSQMSPQAAVKKTVAAANAVELLKTEHPEVAESFDTFESAGIDDIVHARGTQAGRGDA
jgi:hypothetical protein